MPALTEIINSISTSTNSFNLNDIGGYLLSAELQSKLLPMKLFMVFCLAVFLIGSFYLLLKTNYREWWAIRDVQDFFSSGASSYKKFAKQWGKIRKLSNSNSANQRKLSILNAYSLLESSLANAGGQISLEEKLNNLDASQLSGLADLKKILQDCDHILVDKNALVDKNKADEILDAIERAFHDMELL